MGTGICPNDCDGFLKVRITAAFFQASGSKVFADVKIDAFSAVICGIFTIGIGAVAEKSGAHRQKRTGNDIWNKL